MMIKRNRLFVVILILLAGWGNVSLAQSLVNVSGVVTSADDGEPLIGAGVVAGPSQGTITSFDGSYQIKVPAGTELVFSAIGFADEKIVVPEGNTFELNVALKPESLQIEDVVVIAYGVRKKGTVSGTVSTVKSEVIADVPAASFDQALQGKSSGLTVISQSGEPSKPAQFMIRGANSIYAGTEPLFVLDGVPISSSDFNALSPNDIESVSVLKDAASASIYGARASNGVVIITTKRGVALDKAKITFRAQYGVSQMTRSNWYMMNTAERIQYEKEVGLTANKNYDILALTDVNWMNEVFNSKAPVQNYELSVNKATDKLNYYVSGGFYDQKGIAQGSTFRRFNLRTNAEVRANDWLKIGTSTMGAYEEASQADDGVYALTTPISASRFMLPYWNPYKANGELATLDDGSWKGTTENPIVWMEKNPVTNKKYKLISTVFAEISPIRNLIVKTQFGVDFSHGTGYLQSFPSLSTNGGIGTAARQSSDALNLTETTTVNYSFEIGKSHSFNVMLGQEAVNYVSEGFNVYSKGQTNDKLTNVSTGTRASSWGDSSSSYSLLAFFLRGEYNYQDTYFADFSVRTDASSRFGKKNRWGVFWSASFMWNAKNLPVLSQADWLTTAKFKINTGTAGNSTIPYYYHLALVSGGPVYGSSEENGIYPSQSGNEELGWEKSWLTDVGINVGFWNRLNLELTFYNKATSDMLMLVPQSYSITGEGSYWKNMGALVNRGVEIGLDAAILRVKSFVLNFNANVTYNKNRITALYNGVTEFVNSTTGFKYMVGHPVSEYYYNRYAGVNPANGTQLWYDKDGNLTDEMLESDKVMTGKSHDPAWWGGFGLDFGWKGLQLSAQFSWMAERWIVNNDRYFDENSAVAQGYNKSRRLLYDRWKQPGDVTDIPKYGEVLQFDDRLLEDASFLRLKNLSLSYSLPKDIIKKSRFFTGLRIYLQAQNLWTITDFSGFDPEVSSNMYQATYPATRQFTFGVEVSF